jgi:hypothetical protein
MRDALRQMKISPGWFKPSGAAAYASVSRRQVHYWKGLGLRFVKVGNVCLIKKEWLDAWLEALERGEDRVEQHTKSLVAKMGEK